MPAIIKTVSKSKSRKPRAAAAAQQSKWRNMSFKKQGEYIVVLCKNASQARSLERRFGFERSKKVKAAVRFLDNLDQTSARCLRNNLWSLDHKWSK